ncbi:soluble epoxide hydrolase [Myriangium duriaei CBS 260.36]|uniref:Soluble epoxide hydrolase n=1 Tax=Myriangium duriaei CBS 260.36 TaxID=1168546 RepID=A0A9P4J916_9PEZI|nr:soluble epoxide hydrolase [Myriangium duriaei CBS 260.36]
MSAHVHAPRYGDTTVNFKGPQSSGQASVHYIEAGSTSSPILLLLHGFPSSSYQYRDTIGLLADSYHVLAPDLPGFGLTTVPEDFEYTFDNLYAVISAWIAILALKNLAIYIFDYGAPVGLRYATANPQNVKAIITQNGNAYKEGFGQDFWATIFKLWETANSAEVRKALQDNVLTLGTTKFQYTHGVPEHDLPLVNPEAWHFDYLQNLAGEKNASHQLDLFYDYRTNVDKYPAFQKYLRDSKVPVLAVWGKGDPAFIPPGAEAYKKDSPNAEVHLLDAGHFALETKRWEIVKLIKQFLGKIEQ